MARLTAASWLSSTTRSRRPEDETGSLARPHYFFNRPLMLLAHERQPHHELAALAQPVAVGLDRAVVHLDQVFHQRQADAQPALGLRGRWSA